MDYQSPKSRHLLTYFRRHIDAEILSKCNPELDSPVGIKGNFGSLAIDYDRFVTPRHEKDLADKWLECIHIENNRVDPDKLKEPLKKIRPGYVEIPVSRFLKLFLETGTTYVQHINACRNAAYQSPVIRGAADLFEWSIKLLKFPFIISLSPTEALEFSTILKLGLDPGLVAGSNYFGEMNGRHFLKCDLEDMCLGERKTRAFERKMKQYSCYVYLNNRWTDDMITDEDWIKTAGLGLVGIAEENESRIAMWKTGEYQCPTPVYIVVPEARDDLTALKRPILSYELAYFKTCLKDPIATLEMRRQSREVESSFIYCLKAPEDEFGTRLDHMLETFGRFLAAYRVPLGDEDLYLFPLLRSGILTAINRLRYCPSVLDGKELVEECLESFRENNFELHMRQADCAEEEELADLLVENPELRWGA